MEPPHTEQPLFFFQVAESRVSEQHRTWEAAGSEAQSALGRAMESRMCCKRTPCSSSTSLGPASSLQASGDPHTTDCNVTDTKLGASSSVPVAQLAIDAFIDEGVESAMIPRRSLRGVPKVQDSRQSIGPKGCLNLATHSGARPHQKSARHTHGATQPPSSSRKCKSCPVTHEGTLGWQPLGVGQAASTMGATYATCQAALGLSSCP